MFNIVHFEIPADNVERAQKFYSELFGWKIKKFTGSSPHGILVDHGRRRKRRDGRPGRRDDAAADAPATDHHCILTCHRSMNTWIRSRGLGGKVVVPKTAIPGMGYFAVCLDPENNGFGLWEDNPQAQ